MDTNIQAAKELLAALQLHHSGQLVEAEAIYRSIVDRHPENGDAAHLLGVLCYQRGRLEEAENFLARAIRIKPNPAYYSDLGTVHQSRGQLEEAAAAYRSALGIRPDYPEAHNNLGVALKRQNRLHAAAAAFRRALALQPSYREAHYNLGSVLMEQECLAEAGVAFRRALRLQPDAADALNNLGMVLKQQGCWQEAPRAFRRTLALEPGYAEAYNNLGTALPTHDGLDTAFAAYRRALRINPEHADAHSNLALTLLLDGNFAQGWEEYEWRWRRKHMMAAAHRIDRPRWSGTSAHDRSILLWTEQGLGDSIQFIRYAALLRERGWRVLIEVERPLLGLFRSIDGVTVFARGEPLPPIDVHCPLLSLPRVFGTTPANIPCAVPYLSADPQRIALWRERLAPAERRIGIVWHGSSKGGRSFPLSCVAPVARIPGIRIVSLQKNEGLEQLDHLPEGMEVETLGADFDSGPDAFLDSAAAMMSLDLVISADTAIAHLAGALGRPVWVALKSEADWRWLRQRDDSPWYPTMLLFRQTVAGDWNEVFERMAHELRSAHRPW